MSYEMTLSHNHVLEHGLEQSNHYPFYRHLVSRSKYTAGLRSPAVLDILPPRLPSIASAQVSVCYAGSIPAGAPYNRGNMSQLCKRQSSAIMEAEQACYSAFPTLADRGGQCLRRSDLCICFSLSRLLHGRRSSATRTVMQTWSLRSEKPCAADLLGHLQRQAVSLAAQATPDLTCCAWVQPHS